MRKINEQWFCPINSDEEERRALTLLRELGYRMHSSFERSTLSKSLCDGIIHWSTNAGFILMPTSANWQGYVRCFKDVNEMINFHINN